MRRPRLITHNAASVDGRLAVSPGRLLMVDERWPVMAGQLYADVMARHAPQVLLEGSGSFVSADAGPADLPDHAAADADPDSAPRLRSDFLPAEASRAATRGWLVVPDSRGRVAWQFKQFPGKTWAGWHLMVLVSRSTPLRYLAFCRELGIPYLVVGRQRVDLARALTRLHELFDVQTVVATGGGRLGGALLRSGLVDTVEVETVPIVVGGTSTAALFTAPDLGSDDLPTALTLRDIVPTATGVRTSWDVVPRSDQSQPERLK